jgi:hypothetical protein
LHGRVIEGTRTGCIHGDLFAEMNEIRKWQFCFDKDRRLIYPASRSIVSWVKAVDTSKSDCGESGEMKWLEFDSESQETFQQSLWSKSNKNMSLLEFMTFARPSAIAVFIANINPPIPFVDYLLMFNDRPKKESILSSLLVECFLRPFISYAVDYSLTMHFLELKRLSFSCSCRIITPATPFRLLFSKQRHVILSVKSITWMLTRTLCIRACPSYHHLRQFSCSHTNSTWSTIMRAVFDKMVDVSAPWHPVTCEGTTHLNKICRYRTFHQSLTRLLSLWWWRRNRWFNI